MEKVKFDFNKLRGRIIEKFGSIGAFADVYSKSWTFLSRQLSNKSQFSPDDVIEISNLLDIEPCDIGSFFYTLKV